MKKITRRNLERFLERHKSSSEILDIGGGRVETNYDYDYYFPRRITLDIDPGRKPDYIGDIHNLPFGDCSYEQIICTEVLEHCHDPSLAIKEMHRVLKPGGKIILTTRFVFPIHDAPNDYFRYTKYGLRHLFKDWHIVELEPETATLSALGVLLQRISLQTHTKANAIFSMGLRIFARLLDRANGIIVEEWGDAAHNFSDDHIMTTGYYLVAAKSESPTSGMEQEARPIDT